jgi:signal transduction histidine kinase
VQQLSLARDLAAIMEIVRHAARDLTGADGATFVLRDGDKCFYAEEDAIAPLWKGHRFPMQICISGWVMLNKQPTVIEDIYADPRIPAAAYRPTFVKSLAMVPIRTREPLGAIGNYWARRHQPTASEVAILSALADTTSVAMENVQVYQELEMRVKQRTRELEAANRELEAFSSAVSHDLRSPLTSIMGFAGLLEEQMTNVDARWRDMLAAITSDARRIDDLITSLLSLSRLTRTEVHREQVDLSELAATIIAEFQRSQPDRSVTVTIQPGLKAHADPSLTRILLTNLLSNAWKYTSKRAQAEITVGFSENRFFVCDNGAGFDASKADRLFSPFQRFHDQSDFPGIGIGLATVQRIVHRHGGKIHADSAPDAGTTFFFTL